MDELILQAGAHAFGDGSHPTTMGVLAALDAIDQAAFTPRHALDMGAGSGILSLTIAARFGCPVLAVDLDKQAVETLAANAAANEVAGITALQADGFDHPEIKKQAPYDLIVMNILAEPLVRLAGAVVAHLAAGGVLILSGILRWQEFQISEVYQGFDLELTARLAVGDWVTLVWQKV